MNQIGERSEMKIRDIIAVIFLGVFFSGYALVYQVAYHKGYDAYEPRVIEHYYTNEITTEKVKVVYVEKPVEVDKIEYVDKPVYVPQPVRLFRTKAELESWLKEDKTDRLEYGVVNDFDCDEFAIILQANAYRDGFLISTELTGSGNWFHLQNTAVVGNTIYLIEPQNDSVKKLCNLD